jgi:hypothetical protein
MKRIGVILAIAILVLFFASAAESTNKDIEKTSKTTANANKPGKAISVSPPEFGSIQNDSGSILCAEEVNINIPLFYPNLTAYRIIVTHPTHLPENVSNTEKNRDNSRFGNGSGIETAQKIYDDGIVVIEAVKVNPWWRGGEGMNVSVNGGLSASNVTYFRIYKLIADTYWEYPQVFVLYEDGDSRIIPQPPLGLENVTFGPNVNLGDTGQLECSFAEIDRVKIDPQNLVMDITYEDKTSSHVELTVDRNQSIVEVSNIKYDTYSRPFMIFRSMSTEDKNADTDSIRTQNGIYPITGGLTELTGTWWQFVRKNSSNDTYSPEIKIEVVP